MAWRRQIDGSRRRVGQRDPAHGPRAWRGLFLASFGGVVAGFAERLPSGGDVQRVKCARDGTALGQGEHGFFGAIPGTQGLFPILLRDGGERLDDNLPERRFGSWVVLPAVKALLKFAP